MLGNAYRISVEETALVAALANPSRDYMGAHAPSGAVRNLRPGGASALYWHPLPISTPVGIRRWLLSLAREAIL